MNPIRELLTIVVVYRRRLKFRMLGEGGERLGSLSFSTTTVPALIVNQAQHRQYFGARLSHAPASARFLVDVAMSVPVRGALVGVGDAILSWFSAQPLSCEFHAPSTLSTISCVVYCSHPPCIILIFPIFLFLAELNAKSEGFRGSAASHARFAVLFTRIGPIYCPNLRIPLLYHTNFKTSGAAQE